MSTVEERTLVLIKPDAMALEGAKEEIRKMYLHSGLRVSRHRELDHVPREVIEEHYADHRGREYFEDTVQFMCSGKIYAMEIIGPDAIARVRRINGATDPIDAAEGTVRRRFAASKSRNAVHASDSPESARRELDLWFPPPMSFEEQQTLLQAGHG